MLKLKIIFEEKLNYGGSISTLRTVLLKLGNKWRKTMDNRRVIIDNRRVMLQRHDITKATILLPEKIYQIPSIKSVYRIYK